MDSEDKKSSFQTVKHVLDAVEQVHVDLLAACEMIRNHATDERIRMSLQKIAVRQSEMVRFISLCRSEHCSEVPDSWVQFIPMEAVSNDLERLQSAAPEDAFDAIIRLQNTLIQLIETIWEQAPTDRVKQLLRSVADRELAEVRLYTSTQGQLQDL